MREGETEQVYSGWPALCHGEAELLKKLKKMRKNGNKCAQTVAFDMVNRVK